jgi:hypothetical protein
MGRFYTATHFAVCPVSDSAGATLALVNRRAIGPTIAGLACSPLTHW